jgi:hypothetical protein
MARKTKVMRMDKMTKRGEEKGTSKEDRSAKKGKEMCKMKDGRNVVVLGVFECENCCTVWRDIHLVCTRNMYDDPVERAMTKCTPQMSNIPPPIENAFSEKLRKKIKCTP